MNKNFSLKTKFLTAISLCLLSLGGFTVANATGDIKMPDGGDVPIKKPAIYLYSDNLPKMVNVRLDYFVLPKNTVPKTYLNSWKVIAHKDGHITDLRPEKTDCNSLSATFGFEYAQSACQANNYPYIYWDGDKFVKEVPKKLVGWSVKKENIETFLNEKADEMAMNTNEKTEFVRYWSEIISNYPATDFRVYFLQNEEVDEWIKLSVSPKPDSWNRIEVVFTPIQPNTTSTPYTLKKIQRKGFTMVEWGGIIVDKDLNKSQRFFDR